MSDSSDREEQIFAGALAVPEGERQRFLDQACAGDAELRKRIEALLEAHASAGGFMSGEPTSDTWGSSVGSWYAGQPTLPGLSTVRPLSNRISRG